MIERMEFLKRPLLAWLVYLVAFFAVYGWYANNPFVMDDILQVEQNQHIQSLNNIADFFTSSSMGSGGAKNMAGIYYKPMMTTYYAVIWALGGRPDRAWLFRVPIFALQATNAFFIFLLSLEFLPPLWAFSIGMLYQLHPVNAEMVLYIADVQDVLYMFFGLLTLVAIMRLRGRPTWLVGLFTLVSLVGAVLSKETGVLFLPISLAWALAVNRKAIWSILLTSTAVGAGYMALRAAIGLTHTLSPSLHLHQISTLDRLKMVPLVIAHYIEILLLPIRISLGTDFRLDGLTLTNFVLPLFVVATFLWAFIKWLRPLAIRNGHKRHIDFFSIVLVVWFLLHGQVFVPLDAAYTDRWLPLVVWSFFSMLAMAIFSPGNGKREFSSRTLAIFVGFALVTYVIRDIVRAEDWTSAYKLYSREAELHPWDAVMVNNVGVELFNAGKILESEPYFARATELNKTWNVPVNNLGAIEERQGNFDNALTYYKQSYLIAPYTLAYENYAKLLCRLGRLDECYQFVEEILPRYPNNDVLIALMQVASRHRSGASSNRSTR